MAKPRTYKCDAVVLRQRPLGEADRLLTLFTSNVGKVTVVGRGIRRPSSKMGGHLDLLNVVSVSVAEGRTLDTITEAQVLYGYPAIRRKLRLISLGIYVAELVDAFSEEKSPNMSLYRLLVNILHGLEKGTNIELAIHYFETRLLIWTGYMPELRECVSCRKLLEIGDHYFTCAAGGVICPGCRSGSEGTLIPLSLNSMKVFRFMSLDKTGLDAILNLKIYPDILQGLERVLGPYLRYILEKEVRSLNFVRMVSSP